MTEEAYAEIADLRNRLGKTEEQRDKWMRKAVDQAAAAIDERKRAEKSEGALRAIVETPAEVEMHGDCAYCQSKRLAREALDK